MRIITTDNDPHCCIIIKHIILSYLHKISRYLFHSSDPSPIFFVASRGHHADIGGITPGSMPPNSTSLDQEGAAFRSFLLVEEDHFREAELCEALLAAGGRNLSDNVSDLRAQVAANQKGISLVGELISQYGLGVVQAYMGHVQRNAELAVREMLRTVAAATRRRTSKDEEGAGGGEVVALEAEERMDDGSRIALRVEIDERDGSAVCDFT